MRKYRQIRTKVTAILVLLALGFGLTVTSAVYQSSYLALLGLAIIFWGAILLYVSPSKQIPIAFLTALTATSSSNTERLLTELKSDKKAIYLPPKSLENAESSLIFIPKTQNQTMPTPQETNATSIFDSKQDALFLTPPGFALIKLYEQKLGTSFTKITFKDLRKNLSKLLVEDFGIAEDIDLQQNENNKIILEIRGSIFREDCLETQKFPLTHNSIGCLLSSSLAAVLAKTIGKPVIIENEEHLRFEDNKDPLSNSGGIDVLLPPLGFTDLSLLFAVGSIVLLITAELSSTYYGQTTLTLNRQKLKNAAYFTGALFLITAAIQIIIIIFS